MERERNEMLCPVSQLADEATSNREPYLGFDLVLARRDPMLLASSHEKIRSALCHLNPALLPVTFHATGCIDSISKELLIRKRKYK